MWIIIPYLLDVQSPNPKPCAVGRRGAAPRARRGRGTPRAHRYQRRTSSTAALAPIRMHSGPGYAASSQHARPAHHPRVRRGDGAPGYPGVCAAAPRAEGTPGNIGVVGGKSTRAYTRSCHGHRAPTRDGAHTHIRVWPSAFGEDPPIGKARPNQISQAGYQQGGLIEARLPM